jgi:hypothetical protein
MTPLATPAIVPLAARIGGLDWETLERSLWAWGWAKTPPLLAPAECAALVALYPDDGAFRSRIDMARYRFGVGDYKYFAAPLPAPVAELRRHFYPRLAAVANGWEQALGSRRRYPPDLDGLLALCRRAGQTKPTPLLLHYETGGYNCLHQDLYGEVAFPLQVTVFLSRRGLEYEGGEFLLVEQRPRAQSRADVIPTEQGEAVIFTTRHRPVAAARGWSRATMRHGVSRVTRGSRYTLGVIFHDAA